MQRLRIFGLALACASLGLARSAAAFCQTHTCEFSGTQMCTWDAAAGCWTGGAIAHWSNSCMTFAVQLDGSRTDRISSNQVLEVLREGFRSWSQVSCGSGLSPELTATYRGLTRCNRVEFNCGAQEDNDNIVMFRDGSSDLSESTIALSTIIANTATGQILDVDIEINSRDFDFYVDEVPNNPDAHDLRLVLNHELGHFLGLSHTLERGALMRASYDGFDSLPGPDDVAGICQALNRSQSDPTCPVEPSSGECVGIDATCPAEVQPIDDGGCAVSAPGSGRPTEPSPLGAGLAIGTGLLLFVRGRSTRGRRRLS